jgi:hypothetical protein
MRDRDAMSAVIRLRVWVRSTSVTGWVPDVPPVATTVPHPARVGVRRTLVGPGSQLPAGALGA